MARALARNRLLAAAVVAVVVRAKDKVVVRGRVEVVARLSARARDLIRFSGQ
jgi:hypothetical protein